jgi:hypothetical protein
MNVQKNFKKYILKEKIQKINEFFFEFKFIIFLRTFVIVHMIVHKNKKMLGTILNNPKNSITFKYVYSICYLFIIKK